MDMIATHYYNSKSKLNKMKEIQLRQHKNVCIDCSVVKLNTLWSDCNPVIPKLRNRIQAPSELTGHFFVYSIIS